MVKLSSVEDADSTIVQSSDGSYSHIERHANRILIAGALVAGNVAVVEIVRLRTGETIIASLSLMALVTAMFFLLYRLGIRTLRYAVDSARLHSRLSSSMMNAVTQLATDPAGSEGTAQTVCMVARDSGCSAYIWSARSRTLCSPISGEEFGFTAASARRLNEAMKQRKPLLISDVDVCGFLPVALTARQGAKACMVAPMWVGEELVGIVMRRYANTQIMLRSHGAGLVSGIAAIGAVSIGKAMVVDLEQQRVRDNALLLKSVHLAAEVTEVDQISCYAMQASQALDSNRCAVFAAQGGQLAIAGTHGIDRMHALSAHRISLRSEFATIVQQVVTSPCILRLSSLDNVTRDALAKLGFSDEIVAQAVVNRGHMVGVMVLECPGDALEDRCAALLAAVSRQLSISIERRQMLRAIQKRSRHLACTPKLARSLTGQRDPGSIARLTVRELHDGFGFGRVSIALSQPDNSLRIAASSGMLAQSSVPVLTTPVLEAAFRTARPYVSCAGESHTERRHPRIDDSNAPAGCRSQLVVPIVTSDSTCIGVIAVYERDPDSLAEDDLHMLETIADQVAGTLEQASLFETLERSYFKTVEALSAALEAKDAYTLDHARSITEVSAAVGRRLGMLDHEIRDLKFGALLHDIGKIGVPGDILNKPGPLDPDEVEVMKTHTVIGEQIIAPIEFLKGVRPLVLHEHERWDGAGYPHGLQGTQIPLGARIIFVADAYHAMTSDRPYRKALATDEARARLRRSSGKQFDPEVVEAFLSVLDSGEAKMVSATEQPAFA